MKKLKVLFFIAVLGLTACKSSSEGSLGSNNVDPPSAGDDKPLEGDNPLGDNPLDDTSLEDGQAISPNELPGSLKNPLLIDLAENNKINEFKNFNYYKYSAVKNEKLVIHTLLDTPLSKEERASCHANPGTGSLASNLDMDIHVFDKNLNRIVGICGENLTFVAPEDGDYILNFDFPDHGPGFFNASSIKVDSVITAPEPNELQGTLNEPLTVKVTRNNKINKAEHFNYYIYSAEKDEKLIFHTSLSQPLTNAEKNACTTNSGTEYLPSHTFTDIHLYDDHFNWITGNCGEEFVFTSPEDKDYIIHFEYPNHAPGTFTLTSIKNGITLPPASPRGTPSDPKTLDLDKDNRISKNLHNNYFIYSAAAKEKLIIHTNLTTPFTAEDIKECLTNPATPASASQYHRDIEVFNTSFDRIDGYCGESYTFEAPIAGDYIFYFNFPSHGPGYFNASSVK